MENKTKQMKSGLKLLTEMLEMTDNGDCIEDFDESMFMQFIIPTLTCVLRDWIRGLELKIRISEMGLMGVMAMEIEEMFELTQEE